MQILIDYILRLEHTIKHYSPKRAPLLSWSLADAALQLSHQPPPLTNLTGPSLSLPRGFRLRSARLLASPLLCPLSPPAAATTSTFSATGVTEADSNLPGAVKIIGCPGEEAHETGWNWLGRLRWCNWFYRRLKGRYCWLLTWRPKVTQFRKERKTMKQHHDNGEFVSLSRIRKPSRFLTIIYSQKPRQRSIRYSRYRVPSKSGRWRRTMLVSWRRTWH